MDIATARQRFGEARSGYLATTGARGPHIVPIVFAMADERIVTAVDHKPKRTTQLRRIENIAADARVCVLVDHYDDSWDALWWVRADGRARVVPAEGARGELDHLVAKYPHYRHVRPHGPVILVDVDRWRFWEAQNAKPG